MLDTIPICMRNCQVSELFKAPFNIAKIQLRQQLLVSKCCVCTWFYVMCTRAAAILIPLGADVGCTVLDHSRFKQKSGSLPRSTKHLHFLVGGIFISVATSFRLDCDELFEFTYILLVVRSGLLRIKRAGILTLSNQLNVHD